MLSLYNRLAGRGLERLTALSDGVFAFAMTVLFLDIRVPKLDSVANEHDLWLAVVALGPSFVMYLMSFLTLGIFWVGQQTQLDHVARSDRDFAWIHIVFLATVSMVPFSTALLAAYITYRTALLIYWFNILALGIEIALSWTYAVHHKLVRQTRPRASAAPYTAASSSPRSSMPSALRCASSTPIGASASSWRCSSITPSRHSSVWAGASAGPSEIQVLSPTPPAPCGCRR